MKKNYAWRFDSLMAHLINFPEEISFAKLIVGYMCLKAQGDYGYTIIPMSISIKLLYIVY